MPLRPCSHEISLSSTAHWNSLLRLCNPCSRRDPHPDFSKQPAGHLHSVPNVNFIWKSEFFVASWATPYRAQNIITLRLRFACQSYYPLLPPRAQVNALYYTVQLCTTQYYFVLHSTPWYYRGQRTTGGNLNSVPIVIPIVSFNKKRTFR